MAAFLLFLFNMAFGVVRSLLGGFVLSKLWAWFIVPVFVTLPELTYLHAVGVVMTVSFLLSCAGVAATGENDDHKTLAEAFAHATGRQIMLILLYPVILVVAYVWHQFI